METAQEINEQEYANGFNRGYWLFSFEPDVAKSLIKSEIDLRDDFSTGFAEGLKQAEHEKTINEFEQARDNSQEQDWEMSK